MTAFTLGTLRAGSHVTYWKPFGVLIGVIETHPDHPPRIHFLDGRGVVEYDAEAFTSWLYGPPQSRTGTPAAKQ